MRDLVNELRDGHSQLSQVLPSVCSDGRDRRHFRSSRFHGLANCLAVIRPLLPPSLRAYPSKYTPSTTPSFCCGSRAGNRGFPCPGASSLRELKRRNESGIQIDISKETISVLSLGIIAPAVGTFIRSDSACRIEIER